MAGTRLKFCIDLHLILRDRQGRILLGERKNTGYMDGAWHLMAGHCEREPATLGAAREGLEEGGIAIAPEHLKLVHVMHHYTNEPRLALFFEATEWQGDITNQEPDKCAGWEWFDADDLPTDRTEPTDMIPYAAEALEHIAKGQMYSERGWEAAS